MERICGCDECWCDCGKIYDDDGDDLLRGGGIEVWSMLVVKWWGEKERGWAWRRKRDMSDVVATKCGGDYVGE